MEEQRVEMSKGLMRTLVATLAEQNPEHQALKMGWIPWRVLTYLSYNIEAFMTMF